MKRVLITGANSFVGSSVKKYLEEYPDDFQVTSASMRQGKWRNMDFSSFDTVYHVAGLAHSDQGRITEEKRKEYYAVNTDLAEDIAKKAKAEGVKQFIFMSSAIVYGDSAPIGKKKIITASTACQPANCYGDSKVQAEIKLLQLQDETFKVVILRCPMIYGRGSKGNFPTLEKMAKKLPIFPKIENHRSMLYIGNLAEFVRLMIENEETGIFWPCNQEWSNTSELVKMIAESHGRRVVLVPGFTWALKGLSHLTGYINKAFGNLAYEEHLGDYKDDYRLFTLEQSIRETEQEGPEKRHILVVSQYFYPETFRINDMASEWVKKGYRVTVLTGIPNYPMGRFFPGYSWTKKRHEPWNGMDIIRIPLIARRHGAVGMVLNYVSFAVSGWFWNRTNHVKADLVFSFEVSPMTQVTVGCGYARKHNVPHFLYVQDLWPENVEAVTGIHHPLVIAPINRMVDKIYRQADRIFVTSPSFVKAVTERKQKVDKEKVFYWPQYAEEYYQPMERQPVECIPDDGTFKIAFTGNIGTAQGLEILPKTAEIMRNEQVTFVIVGDGRYQEEFENEIAAHNVQDKFIMVPRVPSEKVPVILSCCDAGFISFNKTPLWENTIPAKLQSYMACGKAIIASASGETKRIIEEANCGICCEIGNAEELAKGIRTLMHSPVNELGKNARKYFESHFEKQILMAQMDRWLGEALK